MRHAGVIHDKVAEKVRFLSWSIRLAGVAPSWSSLLLAPTSRRVLKARVEPTGHSKALVWISLPPTQGQLRSLTKSPQRRDLSRSPVSVDLRPPWGRSVRAAAQLRSSLL